MFGFAPTTFKDVVGDLESQIKQISYQIARDDLYKVVCADCTEVRGRAFKAVALVGLAEGEFPGTIKEDPFLRNKDRSDLKDVFGFPIRLSTESAEAEFFYEAVTRASDWLLITRPRIADNGAPWQPSPYWEEILRTTDITPEMKTSLSVPALDNAASSSELFEVIAAFGSKDQNEILREARKRYPDFSNQISKAENVINNRAGRPDMQVI